MFRRAFAEGEGIIGTLLRLLVFLSVVILVQPSIALAGVSIKFISTAILTFAVLFGLFSSRGKSWGRIKPFLLKSGLLFAVFAASAGLALVNGFRVDSIAEHFKIIINGLFIYIVIKMIIWLGQVRKYDIYFAIVFGVAIFYVVKLVVLGMLLSGKLDLMQFATGMEDMLGNDMNWVTEPAEGVLRIQLPNEIVGIFALGLLWFSDIRILRSRFWYSVVSILILVGVLSTMSRVFTVLMIVFMLLKLSRALKETRNRMRTLLVASFSLVAVMGLLSTFLEKWLFRFSSEGGDGVSEGVIIRSQQHNALFYEFFRHPFFGLGIGGYCKDLIRLDAHPWMYETQTLAFAVQLGMVGTFLLVLLTLNLEVRAVLFGKVRLEWLCLGAAWLVASNSNPYLFSSLAGIIIWLIKQNLVVHRPCEGRSSTRYAHMCPPPVLPHAAAHGPHTSDGQKYE